MPWMLREDKDGQYRTVYIKDIERLREMVEKGRANLDSLLEDEDTHEKVRAGDLLTPPGKRDKTPVAKVAGRADTADEPVEVIAVEDVEDVVVASRAGEARPKAAGRRAEPVEEDAPVADRVRKEPSAKKRSERPKTPAPKSPSEKTWGQTALQFRVLIPAAALILLMLFGAIRGVGYAVKTVRLQAAKKAFDQGKFGDAQKRYTKIAADYEGTETATWAKAEAAFCAVKKEAASVSPNFPQIIRLCTAFQSQYADTKRAVDVGEILGKTHLDSANIRYGKAKESSDAEKLKQIREYLEVTVVPSLPSGWRKQAEKLAEQMKADEDRFRSEKEWQKAKDEFVRVVGAALKEGNFNVIRRAYRGLVETHYFAAVDPDIIKKMAEVGEKEKESAGFQEYTGAPPAPAEERPSIPSVRIVQRIDMEREPDIEGVIFCAAKGQCIALDAKTSAFLWERPFGLGTESYPVRVERGDQGDAVLLYSREEGRLSLMDGRTGKLLWIHGAGSEVSGLPCVYGGRIYVGVLGKGIQVLNVSDGRVLGSFRVDGEMQISPSLDLGSRPEETELYALSENGCLYIFQLHSGRCRETIQLNYQPFSIFCAPLVTKYHVFLFEELGLGSTRVRALYRESVGRPWNALDWSETIPERISCPPIMVEGRLYIVTVSGRLYCFGTKVEKSDQDDPVFPLITGGFPTGLGPGYFLSSVPRGLFPSQRISTQSELLLVSDGIFVFRLDPAIQNRRLEALWRWMSDSEAKEGRVAVGCPQVRGSTIYLSTAAIDHDGIDVTAVDCAKAAKLWRVRIGTGIIGRPMLNHAAGRAYVRMADGAVFSVPYEHIEGQIAVKDAPLMEGEEGASVNSGFALQLCPVKGKMVLFVGGARDSIHAIDPDTGRPCRGWEQPFRTRGAPGPITYLKDGRLVFGTDQGFVYVISAERPEAVCEEFATHPKFPFRARVAPHGNYFLAGDEGGTLHKLEMKTESGQQYLCQVAKFQTDTPIQSDPIVVGDCAYIAEAAGAIHEIEIGTMQQRRDWHVGGGATSGLSYSEEYHLLLFGCADGQIHALSTKSGKGIWVYPSQQNSQTSIGTISGRPYVRGDVTYIGTTDGWVHALETKTGKLLWKRCIGAKVSGELAACKDGILAPCADGRLCKLPFDYMPGERK